MWITLLLTFFKNEKLLVEIGIAVLEKLVKSTENQLDDEILEIVKKKLTNDI